LAALPVLSYSSMSSTAATAPPSTPVPTIEAVLERIRSLGINFIAIDFDQTLIDIHTGGAHKGTLDELIPHVRPIFIELISAALQPSLLSTATTEDAIHIAIVTYSKQPTLIRSVLEHVFGMDTASKIVIRGNDKSWTYEGNGMQDGKQAHMASAVEELLHHHMTANHDTFLNVPPANNNIGATRTPTPASTTTTATSTTTTTATTLEITRRTSLLIDDDTRNVRCALRNGTRAIWYNPKALPQHLYYDLVQLV
jgi:hypothetical protein